VTTPSPICWTYSAWLSHNALKMGKVLIYSRLTTPVAYLTVVPQDLFTEKGGMNDTGGRTGVLIYEYQYWNNPIASLQQKVWFKCAALGYLWYLRSSGPSRMRSDPAPGPMCAGTQPPNSVYDPSNGTVSYGQIIRTNKGFFLGQPGS